MSDQRTEVRPVTALDPGSLLGEVLDAVTEESKEQTVVSKFPPCPATLSVDARGHFILDIDPANLNKFFHPMAEKERKDYKTGAIMLDQATGKPVMTRPNGRTAYLAVNKLQIAAGGRKFELECKVNTFLRQVGQDKA